MVNGHQLKRLLLLFLLAVNMGCVHYLPEHAKPRFLAPEVDNQISKKGFSYRQLEITDFQAESLPVDFRKYTHKIGAQSCIGIRPSKDTKISITQALYQDMLFYTGTISQLKFEAVFVPSCSWWNTEVVKSREEYVLQHEQVHFALAELAARKLTMEASSEAKSYLAIGNNYIQVQEDVLGKLKSMGREMMEASLKEHTEFDEDTSMLYDPHIQKKWRENVRVRLGDQDNL